MYLTTLQRNLTISFVTKLCCFPSCTFSSIFSLLRMLMWCVYNLKTHTHMKPTVFHSLIILLTTLMPVDGIVQCNGTLGFCLMELSGSSTAIHYTLYFIVPCAHFQWSSTVIVWECVPCFISLQKQLCSDLTCL
jgi:hypothetical protein